MVIRLLPRSTVFTGVPTMYTRMLASPALDAEACRNMRLFISGSAPLSAETFHAFRERTGRTILECWGMTETLTNASNPLMGERRAGSVGLPVPGVELRTADDDGRPRPKGEAGVLEVRPAQMFAGYWRRPEETRAVFRPDGYFVTGDLGRIDEDGFVTIVGRAKDMIISGGYNVYPKEVEATIDRIEGVTESAVIGVPHPDFGEGVVAVVERQPGREELTGGRIIHRLKEVLASFKIPKKVFLVDALPRNDIGKVQKHILRERYRDTFRSQR
jgi:malonyl-CoA/methylmalonyl-CoA synthetase